MVFFFVYDLSKPSRTGDQCPRAPHTNDVLNASRKPKTRVSRFYRPGRSEIYYYRAHGRGRAAIKGIPARSRSRQNPRCGLRARHERRPHGNRRNKKTKIERTNRSELFFLVFSSSSSSSSSSSLVPDTDVRRIPPPPDAVVLVFVRVRLPPITVSRPFIGMPVVGTGRTHKCVLATRSLFYFRPNSHSSADAPLPKRVHAFVFSQPANSVYSVLIYNPKEMSRRREISK